MTSMMRGAGSATNLLTVRDLEVEVRHAQGYAPVLRDLHLDVAEGEMVGLVGESGSGKSMTALTITGLLSPQQARSTGGAIYFQGEDLLQVDERRRRAVRGAGISMVFQEPMTALDPCFTIGTHLVEVIRAHQRVTKAAATRAAIRSLGEVRLPDPERIMRQYPFELSGGMQQRVLIALALACSPSLLIADEPTTALDVTVEAEILDLLSALRDSTGTAILLISHDLALVAELCDHVYVMYAGTIVEDGPAGQVLSAPDHPYTRALLDCVPVMGERRERLTAVPGEVPGIGANLPPCPFAPRCPHVWDRCRHDKPRFHRRSTVHGAACHLLDGIVAAPEPGER